MIPHTSRRQFLKMMAGLCSALTMGWKPTVTATRAQASEPSRPNVLIVLLDAFSAGHASIYGYPRQTTPNLAQFAQRATIYHRHYAASNFTTPGTASLLTGSYPWTNRALQGFDSVAKDWERRSLFAAFAAGGYHTVGYSHNLLATVLLQSFRHDLDLYKKTRELCLLDNHLADVLFFDDYNMAIWREQLFRGGAHVYSTPTSLLYFSLSKRIWSIRVARLEAGYSDRFPRGLPKIFNQVFLLEDAIDWLINHLSGLPHPFMAYFHLLPPHGPYSPRREFVDLYNDGWHPVAKEPHFFSQSYSDEDLNASRRDYDQHIAYTDAEFGRLVQSLSQQGLLDNTYLVVTSDHGNLFERGIRGHVTPTLYEPLLRVPLLISRPGQQQREDVYAPTSCVDVLPTLLHVTGQPIPRWCEGQVVPPFADGKALKQRSVFSLWANENAKLLPLTKATAAIVKGDHKLIHYFGYRGHEDVYEFYDLANDPEEVNNLYADKGMPGKELQDELQRRIERANEPYLDRA